MTQTDDRKQGLLSQLPMDRLGQEVQGMAKALKDRGVSMATGRIDSLSSRLTDYSTGAAVAKETAKGVARGESPAKAGLKAGAKVAGTKAKDTVVSAVKDGGEKVKDAVGSALGSKSEGEGHKLKVTNIVETVDVPVSREVAYQQWTQFEAFPSFMKKVEGVEQEDDNVVTWKAQVFLSHRTWKATIVDQVPNERIVWRSEGDKGHVDGAVTFHELAPDLTRVLVTLEYYPKGLFEHTGNLWRAQGRRTRLELKHFRRHVAVSTLLHQDEIEGWPGEIHDAEVTNDGGEGRAESENDSDTAQERTGRQGKGSAQQSGSRRTSEPGTAKRPAAKSASKSASGRSGAGRKPPAKKTTRSGS
jgi:uncharacterized membrane protein